MRLPSLVGVRSVPGPSTTSLHAASLRMGVRVVDLLLGCKCTRVCFRGLGISGHLTVCQCAASVRGASRPPSRRGRHINK